jgi:hypothetical protein
MEDHYRFVFWLGFTLASIVVGGLSCAITGLLVDRSWRKTYDATCRAFRASEAAVRAQHSIETQGLRARVYFRDHKGKMRGVDRAVLDKALKAASEALRKHIA